MTPTLGRSDRALRWVAIVAWAATIGLIGLMIWSRMTSGAPPIANRFGLTDASLVGPCALSLASVSVAVVIISRIPRNLVAWILCGIGLCYAVGAAAAAFVFAAAALPEPVAIRWTAWLAQVAIQTAGILTFAFIFAYPRVGTASAGRSLLLMVAFGVIVSGLISLHPGPLFLWPSILNPFAIGPRLDADTAAGVVVIPGLLGLGVVVASLWLARRYRRSTGVERLQLKWFASAGLVSLVGLALLVGLAAADPRLLSGGWPLLVYSLSLVLVPIAVGIAILRYRLYAIDHLVDRAIAYGLVTAILVGLFAVLVVALTTALEPVTQGETIPVAAATIVVAALFQPVRRRVQRAIDRRFHRARYDATATVDAFAERLRRTVDLRALEGELLAVIDGTVSPSASSVWVARGRSRSG